MTSVQRAYAAQQGQMLRRHRSVLGMTQGEIAKALGVTLNMVGRYERGEHSMPTEKILRLAELAQDLGDELKTSRLEEVAAELGMKIDELDADDASVLARLDTLFRDLRRRAAVRRTALHKRIPRPRGRRK